MLKESRVTGHRTGYFVILLALAVLAQSCAIVSPWSVPPPLTKTVPPAKPTAKIIQHGEASWYGPGFQGKKTASGESFDQTKLIAAHKTFPLGSTARVTNLRNGKTVEVEITDRGPFVEGRIIDLSRAAAEKLGLTGPGTAPVQVELLYESALR